MGRCQRSCRLRAATASAEELKLAPAASISSRANGALGEQRRAFRGGLYATKAVASATTPPKKYLRADYCCKNQEPGCYGHLFILVFRREPGRCLLRPAAEARLSPTKRSRKSLVARTASAWPALLVQRGNLNGIEAALGNGTAYRCGAFEAARIAVRRSNIRNPHPEYER